MPPTNAESADYIIQRAFGDGCSWARIEELRIAPDGVGSSRASLKCPDGSNYGVNQGAVVRGLNRILDTRSTAPEALIIVVADFVTGRGRLTRCAADSVVQYGIFERLRYPAPDTLEDLLNAVKLVLALHDHPDAVPPGHAVNPDPNAVRQLREAVAKAEGL